MSATDLEKISTNPPSIEALLVTSGAEYAQRIEHLSRIASGTIPRLADLNWCNEQFKLFGRPDLALTEAIELPQLTAIPNPTNHSDVGNFAGSFRMFMGQELVDVDGSLGNHEETRPTPVTEAYLLRIRDTGQPDPNGWGEIDQRAKLSFQRALCIEPEVFIDTILKISRGDVHTATLGPEILIMHGIMSRLVDRSDELALGADGRVNTGYLCANHANWQG